MVFLFLLSLIFLYSELLNSDIYRQSVRPPGWVISSVARPPLPAQLTTWTDNKCKQTFILRVEIETTIPVFGRVSECVVIATALLTHFPEIWLTNSLFCGRTLAVQQRLNKSQSEECSLLWCYAVWLLLEPTFRRNLAPLLSGRQESVGSYKSHTA
jgi:hypothetical protein